MEERDYSVYRSSRVFFIIQSALEYFVTLCVTTTILTALLNEMDVSTSMQGIISAIASLACSMQFVSVFAVRKTYPCKRWVVILNLLNQLLFAVLFCIPMLGFEKEIKITAFVVILIIAYCCHHFITPSKTNWHMSLIENNKRGVFCANREIVSLVSGMLFSQASGILIDYYKAKGDMKTCFIIFCITVIVLAILHFAIILMIKEPKPIAEVPTKKFKDILKTVFGTPEMRRVIVLDALYSISTVPLFFYSVYLTKTFELTYAYITFVSILHAGFRAFVSRFLGKLADKRSWAYMLRICFTVLAAGFLIFAVSSHKSVMYLYVVFSLCHAFALGGINSSRINLCLDYIDNKDESRYVLGVKDAICGIIGFLSTLAASALVSYIESNGNVFIGLKVYPQQVLFVLGAIILIFISVCFLPKLKSPKRLSETAQTE